MITIPANDTFEKIREEGFKLLVGFDEYTSKREYYDERAEELKQRKQALIEKGVTQ